MRRSVVAVVSVAVLWMLCFAAAVAAQQDADRVLLRYKWIAGDDTLWRVTSEATGMVLTRDHTQDPPQESEMELWSSATMPMTLVVEEVDAEGNGTVAFKLGVMEIDMEAGGQHQYIRMDPETQTMTVNGEEAPVPETMLAGLGEPFRLVMSPLGEMLDVMIPEGFQTATGLQGVNIAQWMQLSQRWQLSFPEEPVGEGHCWGGAMTIPLAGEGGPASDAVAVYRMAGRELAHGADCVRIEAMGALDFTELPAGMAGPAAGNQNLQTEIGPAHISVQGAFWFDPEAGQIVASEATITMDMTQHTTGTVATQDGEVEVDVETIFQGLVVETSVEPG
ncbi:MAG: hypothetical protein U9R79_07050 [Armatimonadota bacterium]|nr:hypothetical protein [Armatimonadota bacterium]